LLPPLVVRHARRPVTSVITGRAVTGRAVTVHTLHRWHGTCRLWARSGE